MGGDTQHWERLSGSPQLLLNLETELERDLPDEKDALREVACAIRKHVAGICRESSPLGRFLLVGPNDKARIFAASLARVLFGDAERVLRLEMAAYVERHQVTRLIGHNGGMVCAYFEGTLTEPILREPLSVVLLEGIEHLHVEGTTLLVRAMEEGTLFDGMGRSVSFKNSIFILTTAIGYTAGGIDVNRVNQALRDNFRPEMLRGTFIDDILRFH